MPRQERPVGVRFCPHEAPARSGGAGSGSGRPATLLSLRKPDGLVAGFDFGHRHIRVAVATGEGEILAEESTLLDVDREAAVALDCAGDLLEVVLERAGLARMVGEPTRSVRRFRAAGGSSRANWTEA